MPIVIPDIWYSYWTTKCNGCGVSLNMIMELSGVAP